MPEPMNLDRIILPGLKSALHEAVEKANTVNDLEKNLQEMQSTIDQVRATFRSPIDSIRLSLSQQKGGTSK